jgi:hypothetical protein
MKKKSRKAQEMLVPLLSSKKQAISLTESMKKEEEKEGY